jgi:hypothetical protein
MTPQVTATGVDDTGVLLAATPSTAAALEGAPPVFADIKPVPSQFPLMVNINHDIQQGFSLIRNRPYESVAPPCGSITHVGVNVYVPFCSGKPPLRSVWPLQRSLLILAPFADVGQP